eukprot:6204271-Pleurochrysis_carterae.AAC.1
MILWAAFCWDCLGVTFGLLLPGSLDSGRPECALSQRPSPRRLSRAPATKASAFAPPPGRLLGPSCTCFLGIAEVAH